MKNPIYPCLWYDGTGKSAAELYSRAFPNFKLLSENPLVIMMEIEGQKVMALNGGPTFSITPAISLFVAFHDSAALDKCYATLVESGQALMPLGTYPWAPRYAWVRDAYGMTWQLMLDEMEMGHPRITPSFLFSNAQFGNGSKAMAHYMRIFPNSEALFQERYRAGEPAPEGYLKFGRFSINGNPMAAMDGPGNHEFEFTEGVSLVVECENQEEIDYYWNNLVDGGEESQCGWLKDRFGVSWQIIPSNLGALMDGPHRQQVMEAFLKMKKFDLAELQRVSQ